MSQAMTECEVWPGSRMTGGYGNFWDGHATVPAHRAAWEAANGPIPDGLFVLHRCDNPPCVRLDHLFLGTHAVNMADRNAKGRQRSGRANYTHCPKGHPYDEANTYRIAGTNHRMCRACGRERARARRLVRAAAMIHPSEADLGDEA